jgi:hypothetical protein
MKTFPSDFIVKDQNENIKRQLFYALFFIIFTILALSIDSTYFTNKYFDGRQITNALSIVYFLLIFNVSDSKLKKLMIVMVFLSYIGELIFCKLLGMYNYRTESIPIYVPFGHSIVYASGVIYSQTNWAKKNEVILRKSFIIFFILLFLGVGYFLNDIFSLIFGSMFFLILKRKKWDNMYSFIALCVIFIELVGTYFQCWKWVPTILNSIHTVNPPMGAIFFYAGGDVLLVKIVSYWRSSSKTHY